MIALIPARSGSERVKDKNIIKLFDHPLMAYTIDVALKSQIFTDIYVSSDSDLYLEIAEYYGAKTLKRPVELAKSTSPDQEWIDHAFTHIVKQNYAILRPTNPFRTIY